MSAPPTPRSPAPVALAAARALVLAAVVVLVFRGALAYFFAQDDFAGLARARGVLPPLQGPWRWLSGQGYFELLGAVSGLDPRGYRIASLTALSAAAVLAAVAYRRRTGEAAAWLGALFFAAHPAHFTAVYSVSGIGELLSPAFALAAVLALDARGPARWAAPVLFALSLGCKETSLLLPLVALARPRRDDRPGGVAADLRDPAWWTLVALSAAYALTFLWRDTFGMRSGLDASAAYAMRFDGTLVANALTYLAWTANALVLTTTSFTDAVDPAAAPVGIAVGLVLAAGLAVPALRRRGWGFGVAWYAAALLPVLPLANHTYHYYLLAPLIGAGACVAAAVDAAWSRWALPAASVSRVPDRGRGAPARGGGAPSTRGRAGATPGAEERAGRGRVASRAAAGHAGGPHPAAVSGSTRRLVATAVVAMLGLAWVANGATLVRKVETYPFTDPELRSDATVDRARIARNVRDDLAAAAPPPAGTLRFWSPASADRERSEGRDPAVESYWERNVRDALLGGIGVRVLFPAVERVEFVRAFDPAADSVRWAVYLPNGHLTVATTSELAAALQEFARSR